MCCTLTETGHRHQPKLSSDETIPTRVHLNDCFQRALADWFHQICKYDVCMPACFMRQTYVVIIILTGLNVDGSGRQQAPPGFVVAVYCTPHQLIVRLVCQSVRAEVHRIRLLAYQQPAVMCKSTISNQHAQAQPNGRCTLFVDLSTRTTQEATSPKAIILLRAFPFLVLCSGWTSDNLD